MIQGMTGFGSAQCLLGKTKLVVEVKSLNHRYFDIALYLPTGFGSVENRIQQLTQKYVERGRVTVSVKIIHHWSTQVVVNKDIIRKYLQHGHDLAKEFHLENDLKLSDIVQLPGAIETKEAFLEVEQAWPILERCLRRSLEGLHHMRRREGRSLARDVADKLKGMDGRIRQIITRARTILKERQKELSVEEFQSFQKCCDISEETSRLTHYISEAKGLLRGTTPVGKKIDFIAQEMQRETNTIGSKLQDKIVIQAMVALKSKIEKIREQAQNIE